MPTTLRPQMHRLFTLAILLGTLSPAAGLCANPVLSTEARHVTTQTVNPPNRPIPDTALLAHCGLEGCPIAATQTLTSARPEAPGLAVGSDSLWGTLMLTMAFQRDTELQILIKKLSRVDVLTLGSVAAISGLGLAQGIDTLATLQQEPHPVHPVILGITGTSLSLLSLGARVFISRHYQKLIHARQVAIKANVDQVLNAYETGHPTEADQQKLTDLIGSRATHEFLGLWEQGKVAG